MKKITIDNKQAGQRLDIFLTTILPPTRSQLQKLVKNGQIMVNDNLVSVHYKLKIDDIVKIKTAKKIIKQAPQEVIDKIEVVAETKDYLVINKPAGLVVHPTDDPSLYTLVDWLLVKYPDIAKIGDDIIRPGIVHRLDKEVSGLMVIARTTSMFDCLKQQFKKRTIIKEYQALVYGQTSRDYDVIEFPISRAKSGKMVAHPANQEGKPAFTSFTVIKRFVNYTLLQIAIKTGRTHQIRVHLTAYNHQIVGDNLYSTKLSREKNAKLGLNRLFLVSVKLAFNDLAKDRQKFEINLPDDLKQILEVVK